jgi:hypothetical protein
VQLYAGLAMQRMTNSSANKQNLQFADFLMIMQPANLFELRHSTLFQNKFPIYDHTRLV